MLYKFKILQSEKESKFMGMFGDCIKIRLKDDTDIIDFLAKELCMKPDIAKILNFDKKKSIAKVELPDVSYEIIMSWLD